eukprot:CAMPEP_0181342224 /NCGR_PEP_ID=MMETSP1101-20121128/30875_1 /TAXON_ID=46948 /ORGANISM="Rhodomonas abbreviata, Strain Caron Lab Isolate" /LENGTH=415 /DNA_ID=CAMNT_0023453645 /DNA_START=237 /DNA_END=1484 /DNA_ORIENTATION=+
MTACEDYGSAVRQDASVLTRYRNSRLLVLVGMMTAAALLLVGFIATPDSSAVALQGKFANWTDLEGRDEEAYMDGEKNILDMFYKEENEDDAEVEKAYTDEHNRLVLRLEKELQDQMAREVQNALQKNFQKALDESDVANKMRRLENDVAGQNSTLQSFNDDIVPKIRSLEHAVCDGRPCKDWPKVLAEETRKVEEETSRNNLLSKTLEELGGREKQYIKEMSDLETKYRLSDQETNEWKDRAKKYAIKAEKYWELLHTTPAPPPPAPTPPRCSGLKELEGTSGEITAGINENSASSEEDCRWIIRAPPGSSSITLHFSNVHIYGSKSRVSVFVGPENVALYEHEDVINWSSAFVSFTGTVYPRPVHCNSNEVLVVLHGEPRQKESGFDMSWEADEKSQEKAIQGAELQQSAAHH